MLETPPETFEAVPSELFEKLQDGTSFNSSPTKSEEVACSWLIASREQLGSKHPDTLRLLHILSWKTATKATSNKSEKDQNLHDAETLMREAWVGKATVHGESDGRTLWAAIDLGEILRRRDKIEGAEEMFRIALRACQENESATKQHLSALRLLAHMIRDSGRYADSIPYFREVLEKRKDLSGQSTEELLRSAYQLGFVLMKAGLQIGVVDPERVGESHLNEAELMFRACIRMVHSVEGEESGKFLLFNSKQALGRILKFRKKYREAEEASREALAGFRETRGNEDISTIRAICNLAICLEAQGKVSDAEFLYREALDSRETCERNNIDVASIQIDLANVLSQMERHAEAEHLYREVLSVNRSKDGNENWRTLQSLHLLGINLKSQGKLAEAELFLWESFQGRSETFGDEDRDTNESRRALFVVLAGLHKQEEAKELVMAGSGTAEDFSVEGLLGNMPQLSLDPNDPSSLDFTAYSSLMFEYFSFAFCGMSIEYPSIATILGNLAVGRFRLLGSNSEGITQKALEASFVGIAHSFGQHLCIHNHPEQAESLFREALELTIKALTWHHPQTCRVAGDLIKCLEGQGNTTGSEKVCLDVLQGLRELGLDDKHPDFVRQKMKLVKVLAPSSDRREETLVMCQNCYDFFRSAYGADNTQTQEAHLMLERELLHACPTDALTAPSFEVWLKSCDYDPSLEQQMKLVGQLCDKADRLYGRVRPGVTSRSRSEQGTPLVSWEGINNDWFQNCFRTAPECRVFESYGCQMWFVRNVGICEILRRRGIHEGCVINHADKFVSTEIKDLTKVDEAHEAIGEGACVHTELIQERTTKKQRTTEKSSSNVDDADAFVSYTGSLTFKRFAELLRHQGLTGKFAWMDILCVDQFAWTGPQDAFTREFKKHFMGELREKVGTIGYTTLMIDKLNDIFTSIGKIWVMWEVFSTVNANGELRVLLDVSEVVRFGVEDLSSSAGIDSVESSLLEIDVRKAKAWNQTDKELILELMEEGVGVAMVNEHLLNAIRNWLSKYGMLIWRTTEKNLSNSEKTNSGNSDSAIVLGNNLVSLYRRTGLDQEAESVVVALDTLKRRLGPSERVNRAVARLQLIGATTAANAIMEKESTIVAKRVTQCEMVGEQEILLDDVVVERLRLYANDVDGKKPQATQGDEDRKLPATQSEDDRKLPATQSEGDRKLPATQSEGDRKLPAIANQDDRTLPATQHGDERKQPA